MKLSTLALILIGFSAELFAGYYEHNGRYYPLKNYSLDSNKEYYRISTPDAFKNYQTNPGRFKAFEGFPTRFDLMTYQTPARDQGMRGSCAFFSTTALIEAGIKKYLFSVYPDKNNATQYIKNLDINLSEEYLIWYEKEVAKHSAAGDGSHADNNVTAYKHAGFMLEKDMPYNLSWFMEGLPCYGQEEKSAKPVCFSHTGPTQDMAYKINKSLDYRVEPIMGFSEQIVAGMLKFGAPVIISVPLHQDGWDGKTGNTVFTDKMKEECDNGSDKCGSHSILLVGYDIPNKRFLFKNSWASDWGNTGFGAIPFEYVDNYATSGAFTAIVNSISLPTDMTPPQASISKIYYEVKENVTINGEQGLLVNSYYMMVYMNRANAYASVFLQTGANGQYTNINNSEGEPVAGKMAFLFNTYYVDFTQMPMPIFIPYKSIPVDTVRGQKLFLRLSIYYTSDKDAYGQLYREYIPYTIN